uniref:Uncharacterized protein n=1 Tax=Heterorhabditis bacteriophora TaxID=37862 RepID=A0A1I7W9T9_HETBA
MSGFLIIFKWLCLQFQYVKLIMFYKQNCFINSINTFYHSLDTRLTNMY